MGLCNQTTIQKYIFYQKPQILIFKFTFFWRPPDLICLKGRRQEECSWCSFSMMVKWANDGLLQANDGKMLVNDGQMLVNDGEIMYGILISPSLTSISPSLAWCKPSFAHWTIIEKLHRLECVNVMTFLQVGVKINNFTFIRGTF